MYDIIVQGGRITGDFSLTFAEEYEKAGLLQAGRKLLIVRAAIGGKRYFQAFQTIKNN